jgi:rhodanese-related sulfurtransferase
MRMPTPIDRERVRELVRGGAQLVEVLPADEYDDEHLPRALNIPLKEIDATRVSRLRRDRSVITYCNDLQ